MDREKFISILTDGYEFHNHLLEEVPLLQMMLIRLINDSDNEIWATVVKDNDSHKSNTQKMAETDKEIYLGKILISVDSFSLLYLGFFDERLMFYLYDEEDVSTQIQRIADAIQIILELIQEIENFLLKDKFGEDKFVEDDLRDSNGEKGVYNSISEDISSEIRNNSSTLSNSEKVNKNQKDTSSKTRNKVYQSRYESKFQSKNTKMNQHHIQILDSYLSKNNLFGHLIFRSKFEEV